MSDFSLKADIGADTSDFERGIAKLSATIDNLAIKIEDFGKKGKQAPKEAEDAFDKLHESVLKFAEKVGTGLGLVELISKVKEFGTECLQDFADAQTATENLRFAIERVGGASDATFTGMVEWTEKLSNSLNNLYSAKQLEGAEAQLKIFGLTTEEIKSLIPHIFDLATATGEDLPTATKTAIMAIEGHTRGLRSIGAEFKDTGTQMGNYTQLMQNLTKIQGYASSQLGTVNNQQKEFDNQMEMANEKIGEHLTWWEKLKNGFAATRLIPDLEDTAEALANASGQMGEFNAAEIKMNSIGDRGMEVKAFNELIDKLKKGKKAADDLQVSLTKAAFGDAFGADNNDFSMTLPKGFAPEKSGLDKETGGKQPKDITDKIKSLSEITKEAQAHMVSFGETHMTALKKELEEITKSMQQLFDKGKENTKQFTDLAEALSMVKFEMIATQNQKAMQAANSPTGIGKTDVFGNDTTGGGADANQTAKDDSLIAALNLIALSAKHAQDAMDAFGNSKLFALQEQLNDVQSAMRADIDAGTNMGAAWDVLVQKQAELKKSIDDTTQSTKEQTAAFEATAAKVSSSAAQIGASLSNVAQGKSNIHEVLAALLNQIVSAIGQFITEKGKALIKMGLTDEAAGAAMIAASGGLNPLGEETESNGIGEIIGGTLMSAAGGAIGAIKMASGGIVSSSAFVNVGEYAGAAHNPEVIAPLDKLKGMMGGGGGNYSFQIKGDTLVAMLDRLDTNNSFTLGQ